jgi:hypothetical protein
MSVIKAYGTLEHLLIILHRNFSKLLGTTIKSSFLFISLAFPSFLEHFGCVYFTLSLFINKVCIFLATSSALVYSSAQESAYPDIGHATGCRTSEFLFSSL